MYTLLDAEINGQKRIGTDKKILQMIKKIYRGETAPFLWGPVERKIVKPVNQQQNLGRF